MTRKEFLDALHKAQPYEKLVRDRLRGEGLDAECPEVGEDDPEKDYAEQQDVMVGEHGIEVKSQQHTWHGLDDFPFDYALGMKVSRWQRMRIKPYAIVHVSRPTHGMIVSPLSSYRHWIVRPMADTIGGEMKDCFLTPIEHVRSFDALVRALRKLTGATMVVPSREQLEEEARGRKRALWVRARALDQNARDGYKRAGAKPYERPANYAELEREFGAEVPAEEWQTSIWRMR